MLIDPPPPTPPRRKRGEGSRANARSPSRTFLRRNSGAHAGKGGGRSAPHGHRQTRLRGSRLRGSKAFATPRRLSLTGQGIPPRQSGLKEEPKGPPGGGPDGAVA